jgi:multicomponent Na+:H+ antiporter subunit D
MFTLVFPLSDSGWQPLMLWIAGLTMLAGVLGAASQFNVKKILSFHSISQLGYMAMGLAIATPLALAGTIFYIVHHIIVKSNLFLIGGVLERKYGTSELRHLGGVYKSTPLLAFLFLIPAFSLAGFPPLSGFWGKFLVIRDSLHVEYYWLAGTALFVGLLTLFSMTKIWSEAFWKPQPENKPAKKLCKKTKVLYYAPIISLTSMALLFGFIAEPFFQLAMGAAEQLLDPSAYINAVLGGGA